MPTILSFSVCGTEHADSNTHDISEAFFLLQHEDEAISN